MDITKNRSITNSIPETNVTTQKVVSWQYKLGIALIILGAIFTLLAFRIAIISEFNYLISSKDTVSEDVILGEVDETKRADSVTFLSPKFGLSIPKIDANANVIPNVNPNVYDEYNRALERGVAHAKGTAMPDQNGNVFMFAHSAVNFYESGKYNVYFYLLPKLKNGDPIYVSYSKKIYKYEVEEVKIVGKNDIKYLGAYRDYNTLTLMTCWPAGIDLNRVIVTAKQIAIIESIP